MQDAIFWFRIVNDWCGRFQKRFKGSASLARVGYVDLRRFEIWLAFGRSYQPPPGPHASEVFVLFCGLDTWIAMPAS